MRKLPFALFAVATAGFVGCGSTAPTVGKYEATAVPQQLVPGQKQEIELTLHYTLPSNPTAPTTVSYKAQLTPPQGWTLDPSSWEDTFTLKTTDIGHRTTLKVAITVPADAALTEHVVKLVVTPTSGSAQSLDVKVQVVKKGN